MTIELYVFPPSPRSFKVMAVANHLAVDWTLRLIDLTKGDQKTLQYAALNPNMRAPTLKDGNYVLWESNAINQYLALRRSENGLFPADERARLDVVRWQCWELAHWDPACAVFAYERIAKRLLGLGEADQTALAKGAEAFHRVAKVLDDHLKGRKFVSGEALTLADFSLGAAMNIAEMANYPIQPYAEVRRWHAGLLTLSSWQKTLAQCALPAAAAA